MDLLIDQEFRGLIPPLDASELQFLEESILEDGVRDALIIWNGYIVDGHNRYDIITKHNLKDYRVINKHFKDKEAAKIWIMKNQISRRNVSAYLRAEYVFKVAEWEDKREQARENQKAGIPLGEFTQRLDIKKELASKLNIGEQTSSRIIQIHEKATEEQKAKLRTGEASINEVYKQVKKVKPPVPPSPVPLMEVSDNQNILHKDYSVLYDKLEDNSVDLFFTDPPYGEQYLDLFKGLAELSQEKLKPGGLCLVYSGQSDLDKKMELMSRHLDYWWTFAIFLTGAELRVWSKKIWVRWKPVLVFSKKPTNGRITQDWFCDYIQGGGSDKRFHKWGQDVQEATYWVELLTPPTGLVVDPFCGAGTIPLACKITKRNYIGTDNDEKSVYNARKRLAEYDKVSTDL